MEEDIKKIEYFLNQADEYFDNNIEDCAVTTEVAQAIENLINRNKELKERLQEEINENCILKTKLYGESISKDKIREILDIYDKSNYEIVKLPNGEQMCCSESAELIEYLRELLEE